MICGVVIKQQRFKVVRKDKIIFTEQSSKNRNGEYCRKKNIYLYNLQKHIIIWLNFVSSNLTCTDILNEHLGRQEPLNERC